MDVEGEVSQKYDKQEFLKDLMMVKLAFGFLVSAFLVFLLNKKVRYVFCFIAGYILGKL